MALIKFSIVASLTILLNSDFSNEMSGLNCPVTKPSCPIRVAKDSKYLLFKFLCLFNNLFFDNMI